MSRAYTSDAALAAFDERDKRSITRGKLADFAIIDRDITAIPADEIAEARVVMRVVGGYPAHQATGV